MRLGGRLLDTKLCINGLTEKIIPVNADLVLIEDSEASYIQKKVQVGSMKVAAGLGDVDGPASSTDNALARWDLATGKLLQNSGVLLDDSNNMTIPATKTSIHTFTNANWNEDAVTWTMAASGPLVHVAGNTTTVTATNSEAIVAGTSYKVTIVGTGGGATATYTLGGVTGTTIAASGAIAITDYITASTTASLIITPANTCTVSISSITIEKQTTSTGSLIVEGNLTVRQPSSFHMGSAAAPGITLSSSASAGFFAYPTLSSTWFFSSAGTARISFASGSIDLLAAGGQLGFNSDSFLVRVAANHISMRNSANANKFSIYGTYTDGSNYELGSIDMDVTTAATMTIGTSTAGTGADDLHIAIVPAGVGVIKFEGPTSYKEVTAPAGVADRARIFAQDNGAGKTQLMVIFGTGVAQQLAIEA